MGKNMGKKEKREPKADMVISFRIGRDLYERLEALGKSEQDDAGLSLNASLMARRLMNEALKERGSEGKKKP